MFDTQGRPGRVIPSKQQPQWAVARTDYLRQRVHDMGLLPRLLIAEMLVFIILFAGGAILISQMANSLRNNIRQERLLLGKAVAGDLDAALGYSVSELQGLAEKYLLALEGGDPAELQGVPDLPVGRSAVFTGGILIAGPGGEVLATDRRHLGLAGTNLYRYWPGLWDRSGKRPKVLTTGFHVEGQVSPWVAIAVPVGGGRDGEYVLGILDTADSYPTQALARAVDFGRGGHADIVDQRSVALFSTEPEHLLLTSDHPVSYQNLLEQGEAVIGEFHEHEEEGAPKGESHLMAFVPLQSLPWAVSFGDTVSAAFAPVRQFWVVGLGFMALLTGLAFAATVFVGRRLVQPVKALSLAARGMAEGDRAVAVRFPWGGEIGELGTSLEIMRLRLQAWGSELEEQVRERTAEIEERNRELRGLYETLQRKEEQLRTLLGKVLGAQEDERKRVSRELHDEVGQALTVLSWGLETLEQAKPEQWPHLHEHIGRLKELATTSLDDLRRLVIALRPAALDDLGLVPAIRRYAELYLGDTGVDFQVQQEDGSSARLDPSLESVIYRVVQEAINNVARHSGASQVRIHLQPTAGAFAVTIEDNGRSFDPALAALKHIGGIQGMEERASMVGGTLTVDSRPGRGTTVRLEIPLAERVSRQK